MDWKVIAATFGIVFLAEMGDKTQLIVLTRSASSGRPVSVFIAAAAAMTVATLIAVLVGAAMGKLPDRIVNAGAGVLFIGIGVWTLWGVWK